MERGHLLAPCLIGLAVKNPDHRCRLLCEYSKRPGSRGAADHPDELASRHASLKDKASELNLADPAARRVLL